MKHGIERAVEFAIDAGFFFVWLARKACWPSRETVAVHIFMAALISIPFIGVFWSIRLSSPLLGLSSAILFGVLDYRFFHKDKKFKGKT